MPNTPVFGCKELEKALTILGFDIYEGRGKGGHKLAKHPSRTTVEGQAPFITIRGLKEYGDITFRKTIINEIKKFKYSEAEILLALKGKKVKNK